ncbi:elongation factor P [Candidatus Kaiserbacteria bacterium]|nr:elongation factor P [Candidatus Kaiserbacteria bacterium]
MAKLQYNEITTKKAVVMDGDPYLVLSSALSKKDRQKASNNVKMKNLRTGGVVDRTFHQSDTLEEADIEKREVKFLYENRGEYFFCTPDNPRDRFSFEKDIIGDQAIFLKENSLVEALAFNDEIMSISLPIKVDLEVTEAAPAVKGNTSSGATKEVKLESGATIQVPMFINEGDVVRVNTEEGAYAERVEKA